MSSSKKQKTEESEYIVDNFDLSMLINKDLVICAMCKGNHEVKKVLLMLYVRARAKSIFMSHKYINNKNFILRLGCVRK